MARETTAAVLARIEERLNNHIDNSEKALQQILNEAKKTNGRVTTIETWKNKIKGAWAMLILVAAGTGTIAALVVEFFKG
jgi:uncharacterized protein YgbK (DUF1537 family)